MKQVRERLDKLNILWENLSDLTVLAERPYFDPEVLTRLEEKAIEVNKLWRDYFGTMITDCAPILTLL